MTRKRPNAVALAAGFVCLIAASCPVAFALNPQLQVSQYAHKAWTVREGFFKGAVHSIAQTPDGYLWFGTEFGLLRFDGVRAVPWKPPLGGSLPSDDVTRVLAARDGTLWIGTQKGLVSWKGGKLTEYSELMGQQVLSLVEDRQGTVWVGSYGVPTGRLCSIRSGVFQCWGQDGRFGGGVGSLNEDSHGNLWVGTPAGLWRWMPDTPKLYTLGGSVVSITGLVEDEDGSLLIAKTAGMLRLSGDTAAPYLLPGAPKAMRPTRLLRDRNGGLWVGTVSSGLLHVYRGRTDAFVPEDGLSGEGVTNFFEDREGNIWVITSAGLDCFHELTITALTPKQGMSSRNAVSVAAGHDGSVWVGTPDGLNRLKDGKITIYRRDSIQDSSAKKTTQTGLPDDSIDSLGQDQHGRIWVTTRQGVAYFDGTRFLRPDSSALDGAYTTVVTGDSAGNVWIGTDAGLSQVSAERVIQRMPWASLGRIDYASTITPNPPHGDLWLGFYQGGIANFKNSRLEPLNTGGSVLDKSWITGIQPGQDGSLWVSSEAGLSRVKDGRTSTFNSGVGLPCDAVDWMMQDDVGMVWMRMSCGLVRVARSELDAWASAADKGSAPKVQATLFDTLDGALPEGRPETFTPGVAKSSDGRLWFTSTDGLDVIDPSHLPINTLAPPVHVEQITADGKTYDTSSSSAPNPRLPPLVRDVEIDYSALSFVEPRKVLFRYRLEGWDRDWVTTENRRQAYYGNLPPGNYRFQVTAANNSGVWNETGDSLDFSIAPAYYQTVWFRAMCVIALLGLFWGLTQMRARQLQREFSMALDARVDERTRIARDLHDTLLQSFQGLLLRFQTVANLLPARPLDAKEKLESAIDLTAQAITEGRDAVQGLRRTTMVNDLAMALNSVGQDLAAAHAGRHGTEFHVELEGTPRQLHPILRDEVYRIAAEALRNAFLHANARHVELEVRYDNRMLRVRVRDDGKGIDPGVLAEGGREGHFGLHGMRERAKMIGGKLDVWSDRNTGTEVELSIPASKAYVVPSSGGRSGPADKFSGKGTAVES